MAEDLDLVDHAAAGRRRRRTRPSLKLTGGQGCEASIDCSGSGAARVFALENTRTWGRCAFVGEGGQITFAVSELLIHKQITLYGSWVTSLRHMEELLEHLVRWDLHPERIVTHRFALRPGRRGLPRRRPGRGRQGLHRVRLGKEPASAQTSGLPPRC